jgi:hypothetical protein
MPNLNVKASGVFQIVRICVKTVVKLSVEGGIHTGFIYPAIRVGWSEVGVLMQ